MIRTNRAFQYDWQTQNGGLEHKMSITNPNGANGTTSDPREQICWDFYVKSIISGKVNAYDSAIKAGYTKSSAKNITLTGWFRERLEELERKDMLSKAEKLLYRTLNYQTEKEDGEVRTDLLRIQTDVGKFLASTLGKNKGYSTKTEQEHSNPDGNLKTIIVNKYGSNDKSITETDTGLERMGE